MEKITIAGVSTSGSQSANCFILTHNGRHIATLPELSVSFYVGDGKAAALKALTGSLSTDDAEKTYSMICDYVYPQGSKEKGFMGWFEKKYGITWSAFDDGMKKSKVTLRERGEVFNHAVSRYEQEQNKSVKKRKEMNTTVKKTDSK